MCIENEYYLNSEWSLRWLTTPLKQLLTSPDYIIYRMMDKNEIYTVIQIGQKKNVILNKKFYFQKFNLVNVNIAKPEVDSKFKLCRLIIKPDTLTTELWQYSSKWTVDTNNLFRKHLNRHLRRSFKIYKSRCSKVP